MAQNTKQLFLEDFTPGQIFAGASRHVSEGDVLAFAALTVLAIVAVSASLSFESPLETPVCASEQLVRSRAFASSLHGQLGHLWNF